MSLIRTKSSAFDAGADRVVGRDKRQHVGVAGSVPGGPRTSISYLAASCITGPGSLGRPAGGSSSAGAGWLAYNLPPAGGRPDLLVTGAVHDPRVGVHEPAKWVQALRHSDPEWAPRCLFRCEVDEGSHTRPAGRIASLR